jgi:hypothetical protein
MKVKPGMVVHTYILGTWKVEAGECEFEVSLD